MCPRGARSWCMVTSTVDAFVPDVRKPPDPLVFVVIFVVFGVFPSSCLLVGISRVSALSACILEQYGGFGQLCFKWPASPQFQQIGPDFSVDVEMEDEDDKVCLTPCPFLLLDLVSREDGEAELFTKESSVGAIGASTKGNHCS